LFLLIPPGFLQQIGGVVFQHFIITRFSYRSAFGSRTKGFRLDPLREKNLERRFKMFEICCLPSIMGQIVQNFTWILIVDPKLPDLYRNRLEKLVSRRDNSIIHEFNKNSNLGSFGWMKPYVKSNVTHIFTTIVDDDDCLFTGFTQYIKNHYDEFKKNNDIPYIKFIACNKVMQWDFFWSRSSCLGYSKPWTRIQSLPVSVGLTIFCKYPEFDFTVMFFSHKTFELLKLKSFDKINRSTSLIEQAKKNQELIKMSAFNSKYEWDGILCPDKNFHYIETKSCQVVVANHINNIQYLRLFEAPDLRRAVNRDDSFLGMAIDYDLAKQSIRHHRKTVFVLLKLIIRALQFREINKSHLELMGKLKNKYNRLKKTIKGLRNM